MQLDKPTLRIALKRYPQTAALLSGAVSSPLMDFEFHEIEPIHDAFKPMAQRQAFDVSEMEITGVEMPGPFYSIRFGDVSNSLSPFQTHFNRVGTVLVCAITHQKNILALLGELTNNRTSPLKGNPGDGKLEVD